MLIVRESFDSLNDRTNLGFESTELDNPALMVCAPLSRTTTENVSDGIDGPVSTEIELLGLLAEHYKAHLRNSVG